MEEVVAEEVAVLQREPLAHRGRPEHRERRLRRGWQRRRA